MNTSHHRIRRRTLELHVRSLAEAADWRTQARDLWNETLHPAVERVFDELSPDATVTRIPRLEITLHVAPEMEPSRMAEEFAAALHDALVEAQRRAAIPDAAADRPASGEISVASSARRWIRHWLTHGTAPWWAAAVDAASTADALLAVLREAPESTAWLRAILLADLVAARRLAHQLPNESQAELLRAVGADSIADALAGFCRQMAAGGSTPPHDNIAIFWEHAWRSWAGAVVPSQAWPDEIHELLRHPGAVSPTPLQRELGTQPISPEPSPGRRGGTAPGAEETPTIGELYPINNAGLILLAPFLPAFFAALGCERSLETADDPPVQATATAEEIGRLVLLAHFVATGAAEAFEPELLLPKLLCGRPPEWPAPPRFEPTDRERAETVSLIAGAIAHWRALGDTSVEGFRSAFLARAGLLERLENGWSLRVESRGWDALLERVPWTFQTVKLPWMPEPIWTEWITSK